MDTTTALENAAEVMIQANKRYSKIVERLNGIENIVFSSRDAATLSSKLDLLESQFEAASIQLADSGALLALITKAHTKINQLIDGTIPVELQYNTDVIFNGKGTVIDKSIPNKIKINNTVEGYSINEIYLWNIAGEAIAAKLSSTLQFDVALDGEGADKYAIWSSLLSYSNRLSLKNVLDGSPNSDLNIYIDDKVNSWEAGQVLKIAFDVIDMSGNNIKIWTGSTSGFTQSIADIDITQLITNKPYIEVVCIDPVSYTFEYDILR
tara:strand:- start:69 stop:866 length:798 start_codon:yes stop_codon:yes gene_type:complete